MGVYLGSGNSSKSVAHPFQSGENCAESILLPEGILEQAQQAADQGKWWQFIQLMGGTTAKRKDNPIKLMKIDSKEPSKYGDPISKNICGVETETAQLPTRLHQWHIERYVEGSILILNGKILRLSGSGSGCDRKNVVAAQPPWSSVNNCTNYINSIDKIKLNEKKSMQVIVIRVHIQFSVGQLQKKENSL